MEINAEQFKRMKHILPVQRGNVTVENMTFINALLYVCENGCKWRRLPKEYGNWHAIYKRFNRWVKNGIINKLFQELHVQGIAEPDTLIRLLDSMIVPVHGKKDTCMNSKAGKVVRVSITTNSETHMNKRFLASSKRILQ